MKLNQSEDTLSLAAAKAGMDEKTARKYRQAGRLPSQLRVEHTGARGPIAYFGANLPVVSVENYH